MNPVTRLFSACALIASLGLAAQATEPVQDLRLYAIDCGHISVKDAAPFSDTGDYDGRPLDVVVSCYLIRHPKGTLLWDAGLSDEVAKSPGGVDVGGGNFHLSMTAPLLGQLAQIGVTPADVTHLAFSHLHFDHTGNANAFPQATWLMNRAELAAVDSDTPPSGMDPSLVSARKTATLETFTGDHDVFGDGKVRILTAPGHTPGHQVLMIELAGAGPVILSGDLYHSHENRKKRNVPVFNTSRAETLASFDRVEKLIANRKARFVVQHAPSDFAALPKFPSYLK